MLRNRIFHKIACFSSALCLLPGLCLPALAQETPVPVATESVSFQETTLPSTSPPETVAPTEAPTLPPATQPPESIPVTVPTEPTEPTAVPTEPVEPAPVPTEPTESTPACSTQPPQTEPATVPTELPIPSDDDPLPPEEPELTLAQVLALPADFSGSFRTSGTVIFVSDTYFIVQDDTGGGVFSSQEPVAFGQKITLRGTSGSQGLTADEILTRESGILPQPLVVPLTQAPERILLSISDVQLDAGAIVQEQARLVLSGAVPASLFAGDRVQVTGIRLGQTFLLQSIQPAADTGEDADPAVLWHAMEPQQIQPEDVVAVTITNRDKQTYLLSRAADGGFTAIAVQLGIDTLEHPEEGIGWDLSWQEDAISLHCPEGWLSSNIKLSGKLQLSDTPDFWRIEKGYLYNPSTAIYLVVFQGKFRTSQNHASVLSQQQVRFWVKEQPEPEPTDPIPTETTQPAQTLPTEAPELPEPPDFGGLHAYFGQLHGHSLFSGGEQDAQTLFSSAAQQMDFFAITDPSHSLTATAWMQGRQAAAAATSGAFLGLYGYEMAWPRDSGTGHITVLASSDWVSEQTEDGLLDLEDFYSLLADTPGAIGQFNHPGPEWGDFHAFERGNARYDSAMQLLDVTGENGRISAAAYNQALEEGWHIAPTYNSSHLRDLCPGRTMVLAADLSESAILEALRQRRVCATEDPDLQMYFTLNGAPMGSILSRSGGTLTAQLWDPTDPIGTVALIGDSGPLGQQVLAEQQGTLVFSVPEDIDYCYLKVTQPDGDIALSAPVWMEQHDDLGIQDFSCSTPATQGEAVDLCLTLYNQESLPLEILSVNLQGQPVEGLTLPFSIPAGSSCQLVLPYTCPQAGVVHLSVQVTGRIGGQPVAHRQELTLRCQPPLPEAITAIETVRAGQLDTVFRIRGYATTDTTNPHTRFPQMLYLQDDTGGIAITDFYDESIQVGTPIEVVGILKNQQGNLVLEMLEYSLLPQPYYRHVPRTTRCDLAVNYAQNGGRLVQVEGKVLSLIPTENNRGIRQITVEDHTGEQAIILIEPYIFSGSTGENTLMQQIRIGNSLRAMGLCHRDSTGRCVLRVRNCEEVMYLPPSRPDPSNPKTGDALVPDGRWDPDFLLQRFLRIPV